VDGNRESLWSLTKWDPKENIIRWAWTRFEPTRPRYEGAMSDSRWSQLNIIRLLGRGPALSSSLTA
jgi:hypothetical protein